MMPLVQWFGQSEIARTIHNSAWLFPFIEIFHLLGLALLGGTVILVNLRFFGLGVKDRALPDLSRDVQPWLRLSVAVTLTSGFLLFISEAVKMYSNEAFRFKMLCLTLALIFTFTIHPRFTRDARAPSLPGKLVALISMALWACVGLGGRAIGFV